VRFHNRQTLAGGIWRRGQQLERAEREIAQAAAMQATAKSRARFTSKLGVGAYGSGGKGRPTVAPRPGRPTTQGAFASHIAWSPSPTGVEMRVDQLQKVAPYWLIQEIGTGSSAKVARGGLGKLRGGQGRSGPREAGNVSVKSQAGRRLPRSLHWGLGSGKPGTDQLIPGPSIVPMRIREEIRGKHYIQRGGVLGFALYERELEQAFLRIFGDHPRP